MCPIGQNLNEDREVIKEFNTEIDRRSREKNNYT